MHEYFKRDLENNFSKKIFQIEIFIHGKIFSSFMTQALLTI